MKEVIKKEYLKCAQDPAYFLKKYAVIQHPMEGKIPFSLYPFQEKMVKLIEPKWYESQYLWVVIGFVFGKL